MTQVRFRNALHRLAQLGRETGIQLVRITSLEAGNRYTARPVQFDEQGETEYASTHTLSITNLAELPDETGQLPEGAEAIAVDVEGRWVIHVQPEERTLFAAKVLYTFGDGRYRVRPQVPTGEKTFADDPSFGDLTAVNVFELGNPVEFGIESDTIVLVASLKDNAEPPTIQYAFSHATFDELH